MARDGVAVDARLAAAVARYVDGDRFDVKALCADLGVRTQTFYKYVARFRGEGVTGFFPRSRRPHHSPTAVSAAVEDAIVLARKDLDDAGQDVGATSIGWWLIDHPERWRPSAGDGPIPSRATINRVLDRRDLLVRHPRRRPRRSGRRFVRSARNALWQMDGYEVTLADGHTVVVVIEIFDDHTRLNLVCHVADNENSDDAWLAFTTAVDRYGLPRQLLTDNKPAFNAHRRGWTSRLEAACAALGVDTISSAIEHPQTCGKVERGHSTARRWLRRQPAAATKAELAEQLDVHYRGIYNNRRNQALGGLTPQQAWTIAPRSGPYGTALPGRLHVDHRPVSSNGRVAVDGIQITVGRAYKNKTVTVFRNLDDVAIFVDGSLIRELTIDRTRKYQNKR
jgi:hypothetical protein